jgi:hypothetical protein
MRLAVRGQKHRHGPPDIRLEGNEAQSGFRFDHTVKRIEYPVNKETAGLAGDVERNRPQLLEQAGDGFDPRLGAAFLRRVERFRGRSGRLAGIGGGRLRSSGFGAVPCREGSAFFLPHRLVSLPLGKRAERIPWNQKTGGCDGEESNEKKRPLRILFLLLRSFLVPLVLPGRGAAVGTGL